MNVNALFYGAAPPRVGKLLCGTLHFLLPGGGHPNMNRREFITPLGGDDPARDCSESAFDVAGIAPSIRFPQYVRLNPQRGSRTAQNQRSVLGD